MSNDLTTFDANLPAYLKKGDVDEMTKALMGGSAQYKRLSIKGNVFRLYVDGKEVSKSDSRFMDVVIVAAAPKIARTYYSATFAEGSSAAPLCWSSDGDKPDAKSKDPQSARCIDCTKNKPGSGANGARACRYSQRLALVSAEDISGDVLQIQLPAQSIFGAGESNKLPLQAYAKLLGSKGVPITAVVTRMSFDTDSATPKLVFRPVRVLTEEEHASAITRGKTEEATRAIEFTVFDKDKEPTAQPAPALNPEKKVIPIIAEKEAPAEEDDIPEPTVRASKKTTPEKKDISTILDEWDD